MNIRLYFILLSTVTIFSCGEKKSIIKNEFEIITIENQKSNIEEFKALVSIFDFKDTTIVCYPLTLNRIDKQNGVMTLDYLANKQVNYEKINPIQRDFKKYFEKLQDSTLKSKGDIVYNIDDYYSLPNSFIFANDILKSSDMNGKVIFNDIQKLHDAIGSYLSNNKGKIYIIYNPQINKLQASIETPKPVVPQSTSTNSNTSTKVVKTETTINRTATSSPCANQVSANSLDECFRKLADASIPRECKSLLKNQTISYFESSASRVVNVDNNGARIAGEWSISGYCDRLMTTGRPTFIYAKENNGSKISTLKITK